MQSSSPPHLAFVSASGRLAKLRLFGQYQCLSNGLASCSSTDNLSPISFITEYSAQLNNIYATFEAYNPPWTVISMYKSTDTTSASLFSESTIDRDCLKGPGVNKFGKVMDDFFSSSKPTLPVPNDRYTSQSLAVYFAHSSMSLVRYLTGAMACMEIAQVDEVIQDPLGFNRTLVGIASSPLVDFMVLFGGLDTKNNTMTVSSSLQVYFERTDSWIPTKTSSQHQIPRLFSPMVFVAPKHFLDSSSDPFVFVLGGCTDTATALDPMDESTCTALNTIYRMDANAVVGNSSLLGPPAEKIQIKGWIPNTTRNPCFTYIPQLGLFVSGGAKKNGSVEESQGMHSLLTMVNETDYIWQNVSIPKTVVSGDNMTVEFEELPSQGHDCKYLADQILFVGPASKNTVHNNGGSSNISDAMIGPPIQLVQIPRIANNQPSNYSVLNWTRTSTFSNPLYFSTSNNNGNTSFSGNGSNLPSGKLVWFIGAAGGFAGLIVVSALYGILRRFYWERRHEAAIALARKQQATAVQEYEARVLNDAMNGSASNERGVGGFEQGREAIINLDTLHPDDGTPANARSGMTGLRHEFNRSPVALLEMDRLPSYSESRHQGTRVAGGRFHIPSNTAVPTVNMATSPGIASDDEEDEEPISDLERMVLQNLPDYEVAMAEPNSLPPRLSNSSFERFREGTLTTTEATEANAEIESRGRGD